MVIEQIHIYNIVNSKGLLAPGIGRLQNIFYLFKKEYIYKGHLIYRFSVLVCDSAFLLADHGVSPVCFNCVLDSETISIKTM